MRARDWLYLLMAMVLSSVATAVILAWEGDHGTDSASISGWTRDLMGSRRVQPTFYYATGSGTEALDRGRGGGNPFADGQVIALQQENLTLSELSSIVSRQTQEFSRDPENGTVRQYADVPTISVQSDVRLFPENRGGRMTALVIALSTYSQGVGSLGGARFDATRLASALSEAGFETTVKIDPSKEEMLAELSLFSRFSADAEVALVYMTGHGVELDGRAYLIPREFRRGDSGFSVSADAFDVADVADYMFARNANLVFFGGCRNRPKFLD